jgi:hypothetical protein
MRIVERISATILGIALLQLVGAILLTQKWTGNCNYERWKIVCATPIAETLYGWSAGVLSASMLSPFGLIYVVAFVGGSATLAVGMYREGIGKYFKFHTITASITLFTIFLIGMLLLYQWFFFDPCGDAENVERCRELNTQTQFSEQDL